MGAPEFTYVRTAGDEAVSRYGSFLWQTMKVHVSGPEKDSWSVSYNRSKAFVPDAFLASCSPSIDLGTIQDPESFEALRGAVERWEARQQEPDETQTNGDEEDFFDGWVTGDDIANAVYDAFSAEFATAKELGIVSTEEEWNSLQDIAMALSAALGKDCNETAVDLVAAMTGDYMSAAVEYSDEDGKGNYVRSYSYTPKCADKIVWDRPLRISDHATETVRVSSGALGHNPSCAFKLPNGNVAAVDPDFVKGCGGIDNAKLMIEMLGDDVEWIDDETGQPLPKQEVR